MRAVQDKNTGVTASKRIVPISVKASVDPRFLSFICVFELKKNVDEVTDQEILDYLGNMGSEVLKEADATRRGVFKEIRIKQSIQGAVARIADLWTQWDTVEKKYKLQEEFQTSEGKKLFRKEMAKALWPASLKNRVERKLKGLDTEA
jgi:hypothetical protein